VINPNASHLPNLLILILVSHHHLRVEILPHQLNPSVVIKCVLHRQPLLLDLAREHLARHLPLLLDDVFDLPDLFIHPVNLIFKVSALLFVVVMESLLLPLHLGLKVINCILDGFVSVIEVLLGFHLLLDGLRKGVVVPRLQHLIIEVLGPVHMHRVVQASVPDTLLLSLVALLSVSNLLLEFLELCLELIVIFNVR
jgi:hypothetical protein